MGLLNYLTLSSPTYARYFTYCDPFRLRFVSVFIFESGGCFYSLAFDFCFYLFIFFLVLGLGATAGLL